ncbi:MAG: DNA processing protein DprA, partial [Cyanothece sp. SIO1E1]|nr:DNA processing protein DprA [Cyanothece sp. SIO1E1]
TARTMAQAISMEVILTAVFGLYEGALITARLANDYGRDVYALPGSLDNPRCLGCLSLLNQGAQVILGEGHLLEALGAMPHLHVVESSLEPEALPAGNLPPRLEQVLRVIPQTPILFDVIVHKSGLDTSAVLSTLVELELLGLVMQLPGMQYQRC